MIDLIICIWETKWYLTKVILAVVTATFLIFAIPIPFIQVCVLFILVIVLQVITNNQEDKEWEKEQVKEGFGGELYSYEDPLVTAEKKAKQEKIEKNIALWNKLKKEKGWK